MMFKCSTITANVPKIPSVLRDVRHVVYCCPGHFNGIAQFVLHATSLDITGTLQEMGHWWRLQNWSISSYSLTWIVAI
jgi:hypothetical protein